MAVLAAFALVLVLSGGGSQAAQRVARPEVVRDDAPPTTPAHSYAPSSERGARTSCSS